MSAQQEPGLISGHAAFAKGAAVETIGNTMGSAAWSESGAQQKQAGIDEMKAAGEKRDQDNAEHGMGKPEQLLGQVTGCEGMEKEGAASSAGGKPHGAPGI